jgi:hypothetical protein
MKQASLMVCVSDPSYKGSIARRIMVQGQTHNSLGSIIRLHLSIIKSKMERVGAWLSDLPSKSKVPSLNPSNIHIKMETKTKNSATGHTWNSSHRGTLDHRK